ncbi:MAG: TetR-like C-terminal domain-containing protein [Anaerocolumna sp.]
MEKKKLDRRVKYTKMVIKDSFIALLREKPISKITVKEICDDADINRATFYSHYMDQYDLLRKIEEEIFYDVNKYVMIEYSPVSVESISMLAKLFEYIRKNGEICKVLLGDNVDTNFQKLISELFQRQFVSVWIENKSVSVDDAEFIYTFMLAGSVGCIKKWLDSDMKKSDEEMAGLIIKLSHKDSSAF